MVERQLAARGIRDARVLDAMGRIQREVFVGEDLRDRAYDDAALPIEEGQTVSQPYIVALMAESLAIEAGDRLLEIGVGSGYAAAVYAGLAKEVFGVERHAALVDLARRRFAELGIDNVPLASGDGSLGWREHAPFDAISVAAGGPEVGPALLDQLAVGGRLVMPVGTTRHEQQLVRVTKQPSGALQREMLGSVRFVPLVGEQGWGTEES